MSHSEFWKKSKVREEVLSLIKQYPYDTFTYDDIYEFALAHGWKHSINTIERVLRALGQEGVINRIYGKKKVIFSKKKADYEKIQKWRERYVIAVANRKWEEVRKVIEEVKKEYHTTDSGAREILGV